jgi:hypothetical protein
LQSLYKYSNHCTIKDCVGFRICLLLFRGKFSLRLALRYLEHVHDS